MAHRYQLDLATMLTVLADHTGRLSTTGVMFPGMESPCEVVVSVLAGQVRECCVISREQGVFLGDAVLQAVLALGVLCWTYTPDELPCFPPASTPARSPSEVAVIVPQRTRLVSPNELATWPRLARSLYQLIDGKREMAYIAHLLSQRLEVVCAEVVRLHQQGVLHLASQQERQEVGRSPLSAVPPSFHQPWIRKDSL